MTCQHAGSTPFGLRFALCGALLASCGQALASQASVAISPISITTGGYGADAIYEQVDEAFHGSVNAELHSGPVTVGRTWASPGFMPSYAFTDSLDGAAVAGSQSLQTGTLLSGQASGAASSFAVSSRLYSYGDGISISNDAFMLYRVRRFSMSFNVTLSAFANGCTDTCEQASASFAMVLSGDLFPVPSVFAYDVGPFAVDADPVTENMVVPVSIDLVFDGFDFNSFHGFEVEFIASAQGIGAASAVPEPPAHALLLSGLAAVLVQLARKFRARRSGGHMRTLALAMTVCTALPAQAALLDRGNGLIYDTDLNITWLKDWNTAAGSSYDDGSDPADGRLTWDSASAWAENLVYGGYSDWRLPSALNADGSAPCVGYHCTGSELGHLWYGELDNVAGTDWTNTAPFENVQMHIYWLQEPGEDPETAWSFTPNGLQVPDYASWNHFYAVAVRPGDVAAVPEPETCALFLGGLALLVGLKRRSTTPVRGDAMRHAPATRREKGFLRAAQSRSC